jgi:uncharacterized protein (TIGR02118 family)
MFKVMILLKRKDNDSHAKFSDWWLVKHRPLAEKLPNVRRVVFNLADESSADMYDGVSELWFDNQAQFEAAYSSDIGKAVAADSLDNVGARTRMFVTEHVIKAEA